MRVVQDRCMMDFMFVGGREPSVEHFEQIGHASARRALEKGKGGKARLVAYVER